jgi:cytochrome c oxidase subunit II
MTRLRRFVPLASVALLLFLTACAQDAPTDTLEPEGPIARKIDNLVNPVFLAAGVVFVLVEVGAILIMRRYRARPDDDDNTLPPQVHGNTVLEIGWIAVPFVILAVIAVFTVTTVFSIDAEADDAEMSVQVVGQQWWWEYRYDVDHDGELNDPDDVVTANDLVIPAGQNVRLDLTSRDVIHSFWIPKLNGKKDAVPGRHHELTVAADEPGTFVGHCTEFCGLSHAYMRQRLIALPQGDFDAWLDNQTKDAQLPASGDAKAGGELFVSSCSRCHLIEGVNDDEYEEQGSGDDVVSGHAPNLTHFATRGAFAGAIFPLWQTDNPENIVQWDEIGGTLDRDTLEAWLRDPPAEKPMAAELEGPSRGMPDLDLSEEQIDQLVAFLETLD